MDKSWDPIENESFVARLLLESAHEGYERCADAVR